MTSDSIDLNKELVDIAMTIYFCENGFSSFTYNLTDKYRHKINVEDDLRMYLTKLEPNVDEICKQKQVKRSQ